MKEVAFLYDFDNTLSPMNMQEFDLIPDLGYDINEFWSELHEFEKENEVDLILSYLLQVKELYEKKFNKPLTREILNEYGKKIRLFPGVKTWFMRINQYGAEKGVKVRHYILSSGMKEMIEATSIGDEFEKIYASSYIYNKDKSIKWPALAVNYTNKTQFVYRINKGALDVYENEIVNSYIPKEQRPIPFQNIAYFGDGETDVPCMKIIKNRGGYAIAVYNDNRDMADDFIMQNRVTTVAKADYSKDSKLEQIAKYIIDKAITE